MKFSKHFNLRGSSFEFFDIEVKDDMEWFIDPFLVIKNHKKWANHISDCYGNLIKAIYKEDELKAEEIVAGFKEYSQTHLGYGKQNFKGKGASGNIYTKKMLIALFRSSLKDLEQLALLQNITLAIEGFAEDRVSDITSNIISTSLVAFTLNVCAKYDVDTYKTSIKVWNIGTHSWKVKECYLPSVNGESIVLVPKDIVTRSLVVTKQMFYNHVIIPIEQGRAFKNGMYRMTQKGIRMPLFKKDIQKDFPYSSSYVVNYIQDNPNSLKDWRPKPNKRRQSPE